MVKVIQPFGSAVKMQKTLIHLLILLQYSQSQRIYSSPQRGFTPLQNYHEYQAAKHSCQNSPFDIRKPGTNCPVRVNRVPPAFEQILSRPKFRPNKNIGPIRISSHQPQLISRDGSSKNYENIDRQSGRIRNGTALNNMAGVIEGVGTFFCGLRASTEGNSLVQSIFTRDIGWYRCYFHGGAYLAKIAVLGSGFYQCFYQRPANAAVIRQGIANYFCYFQGIRHAHGFIQRRPPPLQLKNFVYIMGSVSYALAGAPLSPASGQLLGIYNFGQEGQQASYGLLQARETLNVALPPLPLIGDNSTFLQMQKGSNTDTSVGQFGLYQYHYTDEDFDLGRANRFSSISYNFRRVFDAHTVRAQLFLLEMNGQGGSLEDDRDFMQGWLGYRYEFQNVTVTPLPSFVETLLVWQYNYLNHEITTERSHGLDFLQWIIRFNHIFPGMRPGETVVVDVSGVLQTNSDNGTAYVPASEQDSMGMAEDIVLITVAHAVYNYVIPERNVFGLAMIQVVKQYYLTESKEEDPGYIQFSFGYVKMYLPFQGLRHAVGWSSSLLFDYVLGEPELTNGAVRLTANVVLDTTAFFDQTIALGPNVELLAPPTTLNAVGVLQCIFFGIRRFHPVCFVQLYVYYMGAVIGEAPVLGSGETLLLAQFYQELRI